MRSGLLPRHLPAVLMTLGGRFPRAVVGCAAVTWVAAFMLAIRVDLETDILSLVPDNNQVVNDFRTTVERFGTVDTLLVVIRLDPQEDPEGALAFADELASRLRAWELIDWVEYRLENPALTAVPLLDEGTLFLDQEELSRLVSSLDEASLEARAAQLHAKLMAPQSLVTKDLVRLDPMGLLPKIFGRARVGGVGLRVDSETGCLIDPQKKLLLMLARPVRPAQDIRFDRELAKGLELRVEEARRAWHKEGWDGQPPGVEFTGGYTIALDDSELIVGDVIVGLVSSLVGVMLLFLLAFRRRAALLYAFLPLVTGLGLTFAFAALALGRLNSLTSAFGGLLIGLGIDFIIVLYGRYVEERQGGSSHVDAVRLVGRHTGVGVLLGAVTTAATFYSFLCTDFRGLWELGLLTGTGILLLVGSVYLLLPALLTLLQDREKGSRRHYLHSFGSDILCQACVARPRITLVVPVGLSVICAGFMVRLDFDDDIRNMRSAGNRGVLLRQEVMDTFGLRFTPMTVRVDGHDEAEALERARALLPRLEALVDGQILASIDTIARIVPPISQQRATIAMLDSERSRIAGLEERFARALRKARLNPAAFGEGIGHLATALRLSEPLSLSDLKNTPLERVIQRYVAEYADGVSIAIYCYPPAGEWRRCAPPELVAIVDGEPHAVLAGTNVVSAELRRIVWGDAARAAVLGMALVFILLWLDFGSPVRATLALTPLLVGLVWMLGIMAAMGIRVNFMNIFVGTMIIGIGVDYGVHLLHRWYESGGDSRALSETAKAIAVAALTTMVGFGSLVLSHFPGLRSVGAAAIIGAASTAVLSMTLMPVLLSRLQKWEG